MIFKNSVWNMVDSHIAQFHTLFIYIDKIIFISFFLYKFPVNLSLLFEW